jgi:polyphosphate kinase
MPNTPNLIAKELSWLEFNDRVLQEAADSRNPVIERLRFLGIFSNNQDEFFKVRVAEIRRNGILEEATSNTQEFRNLLREVQQRVMALSEKFEQIYADILVELKRRKIFFLNESDLSEAQSRWLNIHFSNKILRHIVPILLTPQINLEKRLQAEVTYLIVEIRNADTLNYAIIDVPEAVPRFLQIPSDRTEHHKYFMVVDEIIRHCLKQIFSGFFEYDSLQAWSMKFSRDAEYWLEEDVELSLIEKLSLGMKQRLTAEPVRLGHDRKMPQEIVKLLCKKLGFEDLDSVIPGGRYRNFRDFIGFRNPSTRYLENPKLPAIQSSQFQSARNMFEAIQLGDVLLYYPYHQFSQFGEFIRQAAFDPAVRSIKINIYRAAYKSRIIESLIDAARNGKKVTANIELQARFDEERNLALTQVLTDADVKVTLGIPSLKVHSKLAVVTRIEEGVERKYAVIGTGNFNENTAKIYTDFALFTCHAEICEEADSVFSFIERPYRQPLLQHLLVSPMNTRSMFESLIRKETKNALAGKEAKILLKINNLMDEDLIHLLSEASRAGVFIQILVRGMCGLLPNRHEHTTHIKITSIVDRFLEHSRVVYFHNSGEPVLYISSADWMARNLDSRIEVSTPIYDPRIRKQILDILDLQFRDNQKARILDGSGGNRYVKRGNKRALRSQIAIHDYLCALENP